MLLLRLHELHALRAAFHHHPQSPRRPPQTSMSVFPMCSACLAENENLGYRRFHAQPNACPVCGLQLELIRADDAPVPRRPDRKTARVIREGGIAAVKGIGGFHLVCDASNAKAVKRLRDRKGRNEKPWPSCARGSTPPSALPWSTPLRRSSSRARLTRLCSSQKEA
ncbi:MAG: Sua5/YciO/YrdC/YwlC family protein [Sutterella seckii]